jgi:hypothetical protein
MYSMTIDRPTCPAPPVSPGTEEPWVLYMCTQCTQWTLSILSGQPLQCLQVQKSLQSCTSVHNVLYDHWPSHRTSPSRVSRYRRALSPVEVYTMYSMAFDSGTEEPWGLYKYTQCTQWPLTIPQVQPLQSLLESSTHVHNIFNDLGLSQVSRVSRYIRALSPYFAAVFRKISQNKTENFAKLNNISLIIWKCKQAQDKITYLALFEQS